MEERRTEAENLNLVLGRAELNVKAIEYVILAERLEIYKYE